MVVLGFVSVLLVLIFGPAAPWFIAADRFLFDQVAGHVRNAPLNDGIIISIAPAKKSQQQVVDEFGSVLTTLQTKGVERIIIADPPPLDGIAEMPAWAATLSAGIPVFVPSCCPICRCGRYDYGAPPSVVPRSCSSFVTS